MTPHRLLVFGDQSANPCSTIRQLQQRARDSPVLYKFLQRTEQRLRSQWTPVTVAGHGLLRQFESFSSLVERYTQHKDAVVSSVLHCTAQLGSLIFLVENDPSVLNASTSIHLLGFCTGLLTAAAAATAPSAKQLLILAPSIVSLSLYLSLEAHRRSWAVEQSNGSWTMVVSNISAETVRGELKKFQSSNAYPSHKQAYISAEGDSFVSISGPPSTLELVANHFRSYVHEIPIRLPITAAYHASHLPKPELNNSLRCAEVPDLPITEKMNLVSTTSGELYDTRSLHQALGCIFKDIFQNPISWSKPLQSVREFVRGETVIVSAVGPTNLSNALCRGLAQDGIYAFEAHETIKETKSSISNNSDDVAIIGMAGRFPGGEDLDQLRETISNGCHTHIKIPLDRFNIDRYYDPTGKTRNTTTTPYGCFLSRPGEFDINLFNMSPREAKTVDPTQRLLLMTAYEALEMAGYSDHQGRRIGTFFGQATDDYRETNAGQHIDLYYIPGGMRAFGPGRLNYHFKWDGPSYTIDTACSSSATALEFAYNALVTGDCDMALAGGGNIMSGPQMFAGLSRGGFVSPTGACKTFSDDADGYCRGEGVGVVVLKRLDRAVADGDNIKAVIKSIMTNHSANAASITHPHSLTQQKLYQQVLHKALLKPEDVQYIEMHGTGTQAGDKTEVESVSCIFGQHRDSPLYIGAVKSNLGHGEGAAGIASLIKCILMLESDLIPPHPSTKAQLNRHFPPLSEKNIRIPQCSVPFLPSSGNGKRRILINNFNATGGNTSLLIEDPPPNRKSPVETTQSHHVITVSAKSRKSLKCNKQKLMDYLRSHSEVSIKDVSYTTTARRMHHNFRKAYNVTSTVGLINEIEADIRKKSSEIHGPAECPPIVFLCTGQGSQYPGMAQDLFESCRMFRRRIVELDAIAVSLQLPSFLEIISTGGQAMSCLSSVQTQLALVALEIALVDLLKSWGIVPDIIMGHSLGEYAALCTAGVLSVYDTIFLVGNRARLMESYCKPYEHSMLSIASDVHSVEKYLSDAGYTTCNIACINSPSATVVSGPMQDLIMLKDKLGHTRSTMLEVPFSFHSSQVDPILEEYHRLIATIQFHAPRIPVISTLTAEKVDSHGTFRAEYLIRQVREPVRFFQAVEECRNHGIYLRNAMWLEIGPNPVCLGMLRSIQSINPERMLSTLGRGQSCWDTITHSLSSLYDANVDIRWSEYFSEQPANLEQLDLPAYAFDLQNYWIPYEGDLELMRSTTPQSATPDVPVLISSCLHRIEEMTDGNGLRAITFVSDLMNTALLRTIDGHRVNGLGLCPSSVYTDMAVSAASYMQRAMKCSSVTEDTSVMYLSISRPLVLPQHSDRYDIKIHCKYLEHKSCFEIIFGAQTNCPEHARCIVRFGGRQQWKDEWQRTRHLLKSRLTHLSGPSKTVSTHRILKDMVYKLFSRVVTYGERYQSLREVFLNSEDYEAAATVQFSPNLQTEKFTISPYWVDGIIHLAGFAINAHPNVPDGLVYISTGWDDLSIAASLSAEKQYTSYIRMQGSEHGLYIGDAYLLDDEEIVAVCAGLRFQELKSDTLHTILQTTAKIAAPPSATTSTTKDDMLSGKWSSIIGPPQALVPSTEFFFKKVRSIIAEEINMECSTISENVRFEELGIDSILRMPIVSKIQEETSIYLSLSAFDDYPTLAALRGHIQDIIGTNTSNGSNDIPLSMSSVITSTLSSKDGNLSPDPRSPLSVISMARKHFESRPILLSGRPVDTAQILFLMPDGGGSPSSYALLPALPHGTVVYGLESPFCHNPLEWNCSFNEVATTYVNAIQKIQPHGPYMLGGWSLGGIHAYEAARQLLQAGEKVQGLLLIDTPNPNFLGHISDPVVELLEATGIVAAAERVSNGKALELERAKNHMYKCVESLQDYKPDSMDPRCRPDSVFAIWAAHGVEQWDDHDESTVEAKDEVRQLQQWMKKRDTSFGPNGWDRLLGEVECRVVEGDHLSILRPPSVEKTGQLVADAVSRFMSRVSVQLRA